MNKFVILLMALVGLNTFVPAMAMEVVPPGLPSWFDFPVTIAVGTVPNDSGGICYSIWIWDENEIPVLISDPNVECNPPIPDCPVTGVVDGQPYPPWGFRYLDCTAYPMEVPSEVISWLQDAQPGETFEFDPFGRNFTWEFAIQGDSVVRYEHKQDRTVESCRWQLENMVPDQSRKSCETVTF